MQTLIGSSQFLPTTASGAAVGCLLGLAVVWYLTNLRETPRQERFNRHLTAFMVPLLIMFAYIVILRVIRIAAG